MSSRKRGQQAVGCVQDCNSRGGVLFFKFFKKRLQKHQHKNKRCFSHVKECIVYYHTYSKPTFASEAVEPIVSKQLYKVKSPDNETHNNNSLFTLKCVNSSWSTTALEEKKKLHDACAIWQIASSDVTQWPSCIVDNVGGRLKRGRMCRIKRKPVPPSSFEHLLSSSP